MARFPGDAQVDPRELAPDFRKLPDEVREEVRAGWQEEDAFYDRRRWPLRPMAEQAALFLTINFLSHDLGWLGLLGSVLAGCLSGWLGSRLRDETLAGPPIALLCWLLGLWLLPPRGLFLVAALFGAFLVPALTALLARERAARQSGLI